MKTKQQIRYRLSVSRTFPATHPKAGKETHFVDKIIVATIPPGILSNFDSETEDPKLHTIRENYQIWKKRFEKIEKGEAVLDLYYWTGKPYNSTCETFLTLTKEDVIGIQQLQFLHSCWVNPVLVDENNYASGLISLHLAKNDGLSLEDFKAWFKKYDLSKPIAIIHFTKFRY